MRTDLIHHTDSAMVEAIRSPGDGLSQRNEASATALPGRQAQLMDIIWVSAEHRSLL